MARIGLIARGAGPPGSDAGPLGPDDGMLGSSSGTGMLGSSSGMLGSSGPTDHYGEAVTGTGESGRTLSPSGPANRRDAFSRSTRRTPSPADAVPVPPVR